jgi:putative membrane protein (TIGR04086 family)
MDINKLNFKALNIGVLCYAILFTIGFVVQEPLQIYGIIPHTHIGYFTSIYFPMALLLSGYVAGRIARSRGFFHGALVGLSSILISVFALIAYAGLPTLTEIPLTTTLSLFIPIVLAGLGGATAQIWPKR